MLSQKSLAPWAQTHCVILELYSNPNHSQRSTGAQNLRSLALAALGTACSFVQIEPGLPNYTSRLRPVLALAYWPLSAYLS